VCHVDRLVSDDEDVQLIRFRTVDERIQFLIFFFFYINRVGGNIRDEGGGRVFVNIDSRAYIHTKQSDNDGTNTKRILINRSAFTSVRGGILPRRDRLFGLDRGNRRRYLPQDHNRGNNVRL